MSDRQEEERTSRERPSADREHGSGDDWFDEPAEPGGDASLGRQSSNRDGIDAHPSSTAGGLDGAAANAFPSGPTGLKVPLYPAETEELRLGEKAPRVLRGEGRFGVPHVVVVYSPAAPPSEGRGFKVPVRTLIFLGLAMVGFYLIWPQLLGFWDAVPGLRTIEWFWFAIMIALEGAAFACYWGMMRVTTHERRWFVVATTQMAANAFTRIVPGGAASGAPLGYQMLVAAGLSKGRAVTGLTANTLLSNAVLFMLPVFSLPAILGGVPIDPSLLRALLIGIVIAGFIAAAVGVLLFKDGAVLWVGRVSQRVLDRVRRREEPRAGLPKRLLEERDLLKEDLGDRWWLAAACAAGNWLFDYSALLAALAAVGAQPRPSIVLLGYVVAAILAWIPLTPSGLGFVEVGLAATLGLAGVGAAEATTAVLAYRLVSFWLPIPVGLAAGVLFRRRFTGRPAAAEG